MDVRLTPVGLPSAPAGVSSSMLVGARAPGESSCPGEMPGRCVTNPSTKIEEAGTPAASCLVTHVFSVIVHAGDARWAATICSFWLDTVSSQINTLSGDASGCGDRWRDRQ